MPSRRSHTNSHHGCIQCKSRRVKCDQLQPACSRCAKKGQQCTYRHLMSDYDPFRNYTASPQQLASSHPAASAAASAAAATRVRKPPPSRPRAPKAFPSRTQWPVSPEPSPDPSRPPHTPSPLHAGYHASALGHVMPHTASIPMSMAPLATTDVAHDPASHRLLHHYAGYLSSVLEEGTQDLELFSVFYGAVNRHVFAHPFVRHALLTYSSLHLASVSSNSDQLSNLGCRPNPYFLTALSHKAEAVSHLRSVVGSITPYTCEPALVASGLLVSCAFALPFISRRQRALASPPQAAEMDRQDPVELLAQIVPLFHGSMAIFRLGWGRDTHQPMDQRASVAIRRHIMQAEAKEAAWPEAEVAIMRALAAISELDDEPVPAASGFQIGNKKKEVHHLCRDDPPGVAAAGRKEVLTDSALKLRAAMRRAGMERGNYHMAVVWLGMVTAAYVELLRARDPLALVLLADWVVCLQETPREWWCKGWSEWTVRAITKELEARTEDGGYSKLLDWARREAGLDIKRETERCVERLED